MMDVALISKYFMDNSFMVRASCSADPEKRVHSIAVMDPFYFGGGGGGGGGTIGVWFLYTMVPVQLGGRAN